MRNRVGSEIIFRELRIDGMGKGDYFASTNRDPTISKTDP